MAKSATKIPVSAKPNGSGGRQAPPESPTPIGGRRHESVQSRERALLALIAATAALAMIAILSNRSTGALRAVQGDELLDAARRAPQHATPLTEDSAASVTLRLDSDAGGFTAVVIAQAADCDGNLESFGLIDRGSIKPFVPHRLLLLQGSGVDTVGLRRRLPSTLKTARIELLSKRQRTTLRQLGHDATPTLLLFDNKQKLRYVGAIAPTPMARTVERDIITRLVTNNPIPTVP